MPFNSELESKNASRWSSPKGFNNCFRNDLINYRQTMSDNRFTLVKMNITRSRNHDYKWHSYKMSLTHVLDFYKVTFQYPFFFLVTQGSAAHLHNMTWKLANHWNFNIPLICKKVAAFLKGTCNLVSRYVYGNLNKLPWNPFTQSSMGYTRLTTRDL